MSPPRKVVADAGPAGLTTAILFRQHGYDPIVFERRQGRTRFGERIWREDEATALSSRVVRVERLVRREYRVIPIQAAAINSHGPGSRFRSGEIRQTQMETVLLDRCPELGGSVRDGHEVKIPAEDVPASNCPPPLLPALKACAGVG